MNGAVTVTLPTGERRTVNLPSSYLAARQALRLAARNFTPELFAAANVAMARAWEGMDEIERLADPERLAIYSYMSDDESLRRLATRVERARRVWLGAGAAT